MRSLNKNAQQFNHLFALRTDKDVLDIADIRKRQKRREGGEPRKRIILRSVKGEEILDTGVSTPRHHNYDLGSGDDLIDRLAH